MEMQRTYNFSAGPAAMPESVLAQAAQEMLSFRGSGMSLMEMSHRGKIFESVLEETIADIRALARIPEEYAILFLQGGATTQFSMVPMNLFKNGKADYLVTGAFSQKAAKEAARYLDVRVAASTKEDNFSHLPDLSGLTFRKDADYVHLCQNNTIFGTQFHHLPDTGNLPLVADLSSCIFSEPIDITRYGLVYAGAQKNLGPAGVTLVIIRKDLVREDLPETVPTMLRYDTHVKENSMHNTPPTFGIYLLGLTMKWLLQNGGLVSARERNQKKAALLYEALDRSQVFSGTARKDSRSLMNVTFVTKDEKTDAAFLALAEQKGLVGLKGHRSVGGMRASLYNAVTEEAVLALIAAMNEFEEGF